MSELIQTPIIHKTLIKADRKKVYKAMTTTEGLDSWFTSGSEMDRKSGGYLLFRWENWGPDKVTGESRAPIIELTEPEKFIFKWWEDHYTTVEITFSEVSEGTIVEVTESGYLNTDEGHRRCLECATGWGEALTLLKFYVEHGIHY